MIKSIKLIFTSILFIISLFWSINLRDPHLLTIRENEFIYLFVVLSLIALITLSFKSRKTRFGTWLILTILIINLIFSEIYFRHIKQTILHNPSETHRLINSQLIIGFNDFNEIQKLSLNEIAGIFITQRNIKGKNLTEIKNFIAKLQNERKHFGLPPLIITTDQEGGPVSRLSPLIERQPSLNSLTERHNSREMAYEYGNKQGRLLSNIGINVNFGPVVDLKPSKPPEALDFHTQINTRAIASSPAKIIDIALPYIDGLEKNGVIATLKHFPGLGKVNSDTHHFSAELDIPVSELLKSDWLPFSIITTRTNAWMMLSHVILKQVDGINPVSTSKKVVDNIIRKKLGFQGILVTDDLTMGAIYNKGFCKSVLKAYSIDIDYLLIAYDYEKYYDAVDCLNSYIES